MQTLSDLAKARGQGKAPALPVFVSDLASPFRENLAGSGAMVLPEGAAQAPKRPGRVTAHQRVRIRQRTRIRKRPSAMNPSHRLPYSAIVDRPPLKLPGGARMVGVARTLRYVAGIRKKK